MTVHNAATAGWTLFDSLIFTYYVAFLLPPKEKVAEGMIPLISNRLFFGIFTVLGLTMLFGRTVDAVVDPLVATWSDRSRSPLGRRRTFMLIGLLPLAVSPVLVFFPPVAGTSWINGVYLAGILGLYFFSFTLYVGPYLALIPELGHTEHERLNMTTAQGYFTMVGAGIATVAGPVLITLFTPLRGPVWAYRLMAVTLAVPGLLFASLGAAAVDERRFSSAVPSTVPLRESFLLTIRNRAFLLFLVSNTCVWFLFNIIRSSVLPITITLVWTRVAFASTMFAFFFVSAAVCFPFVNRLSRKWGLKTMMIVGMASFASFASGFTLTGLIGNPEVWVLVVAALAGFPIAVMMVVPNTILAEVCEADARSTGQRREALFFGVQGFFLKLNLGLSTAALALLYAVFGKDVAHPWGVRLAPLLGSLVALLGIIAMARYPAQRPGAEPDAARRASRE